MLDLSSSAGAGVNPARAYSSLSAGLPLAVNFAPDWIEVVGRHLAREPAAAAQLVGRGGWPFLPGALEGWLAPKALAPSAATREQDLQRLARRSRWRLRVLARS